uniref:Metacaspase-1 n=1 Tax=Cannabis sativa TaxID=3483 RepID=A0A803P1M4_CANSA
MFLLVDCSNCRTPLQLPPGATSICCALCRGVTRVAQPRAAAASSVGLHQRPALPPYTVPSPYNRVPAGTLPSAHGRKRALICGVSYKNTKQELKGCINDAKCMKYLLINKFSFPESSIVMLTEEETDPYKRPTKQNMRMALYWLVKGCQPGDSLVFHFSGHGSQQKDYNGDEIDGYDETLCPMDYASQGMIVDDEINATIVKPLPAGVKLHAIIDACHSGTVLDLPFLCRMDSGKYAWEDHRPRTGVWKGTNGGEVISFSGCDDNQTSADTSAMSKITSTGAMTYSFIQAIERGHATTYGNMLNSMRSTIRNTANDLGGGIVTSLLTMLLSGGSLSGGMRQEPQLTANVPFDVYSKTFSI